MKVRFYVDVFPGISPHQYGGLSAWTLPGAKPHGQKRIAFDVTLPDEVIFEVDAVAQEVSQPEIVENQDEAVIHVAQSQ